MFLPVISRKLRVPYILLFGIGILGQLDTRLVKLDKTIAPFGIQPLSKEAQSTSSSSSSRSALIL